jgi:hypothetical protein
MKTLRVDFCDFWLDFRKEENYFTDLLRRRFAVEIHEHPDLLIFSNYGSRHCLYTCPRVFFTGEPRQPDFRHCDYAMTWNYLADARHHRLPLYPLYFGGGHLVKSPGEERLLLPRKTKFCSFVIGHVRNRKRVEFFERLSRYKKVDSGGRALNNIGRSIGETPADKLAFLEPYKFNIAFENQSFPGYTTEKIAEAMRARCVPIYWGSPQIQTEFNPRSFLNHLDFPNEDALIERIIQIDQDEALHAEMLGQPFFHENIPNDSYRGEALLDFFDRILSTPIRPVGARRRLIQLGRWIAVKKARPWTAPPPHAERLPG